MKNTLYMIGNTHFDPVWLWSWDEAMAGIRSTFRSALERMKEDESYIYSFCTPPVFEWIKQTEPLMFKEIKERIEEGRWDIKSEGWWLQPDCNAPMGESLVRQGLYGQRYLMDNFGQYATTIFNADSFGHSAMIPQIAKKCGLSYYIFMRPSDSEMELDDLIFSWQAPDGSSILAYRAGDVVGGEGYTRDITATVIGVTERVKNLNHDSMVVYGVSNHGGAPTKQAIAEINGLIESTTDFNIKYASTTDFFKAQESKELIIVQGELQVKPYGVFSNHSEIKKNNRKAEYAVLNAEKSSVLANLAVGNRTYPQEKINDSWKDVMFNQFHDIIGGACIKNAYFDARNLHGRAIQTANEITHYNLQYIAKSINVNNQDKGIDWNIVVFNLNTTEYTGPIEGEVQWVWELPWYDGELYITDSEGTEYACQVIQELSIIPAFRSRIVFAATIPSLGYRCFMLHKKNTPIAKQECKEILPILTPYVMIDEGDTWSFNMVEYGKRLETFTLIDTQILEYGVVKTVQKTTFQFRNSIFESYTTKYQGNHHIDYHYKVNWNEKHTVLKVAFPITKATQEVIASIPYGNIKRPLDNREYPVGEWLSTAEYSLALEGIFAYQANENEVALTLLRSPIYGDLRLDKPLSSRIDYDYLGQGISEGKIRYYPQSEANITQLAEQFNNSVIVVAEANHAGELPAVNQFISCSAQNVMITVVKKAEESNAIVIRMVETYGKRTNCVVEFQGIDITIDINKYEIKTILINEKGEVKEVDMLEESY